MTSSPSLGWQRLDDVYYRLRECYTWPTHHESALCASVAASPPVASPATALLLSLRSLAPLTSTLLSQAEDTIIIYTALGEPVAQMGWNSSRYGALVDASWSADGCEDLYLVSARGLIHQVYDYAKNNFREVSLTIANGVRILSLKHCASGMVLHLSSHTLVYLAYAQFQTAVVEPVVIPLEGQAPVYGWDVRSTPEAIELLVAQGVSVFGYTYSRILKTHLAVDKGLTEGPFSHLTLSPKGNLVSLYNPTTAKLFIASGDADQFYAEYLNDDERPQTVAWCGDDAVALVYPNELKLVGPSSEALVFNVRDEDTQTFTTDKSGTPTACPVVRTEADGLTVLCGSKLSFLSRVADAVVETFLIGSTSPAAILLDSTASLHQQLTNHSSLFNLQETGVLDRAIEDLLQSAQAEFSVVWQKRLLRAIQLGRLYFDKDGTQMGALAELNEAYFETATILRILNQLRAVGLHLTYSQLHLLLPSGLLSLLLKRNLHYLALKVWLELRKLSIPLDSWYAGIVNHWSALKIKHSPLNDKELYELVVSKLKEFSLQCQPFNGKTQVVVSLDALCDFAYQEGRLALCKYLLDDIPSDPAYPLTLSVGNAFGLKFLVGLEEHELILLRLFPLLTDQGPRNVMFSADQAELGLRILQQKLSLPNFFKLLNLGLVVVNDQTLTVTNPSMISQFWLATVATPVAHQSARKKWFHQQDLTFELENETFKRALKPPLLGLRTTEAPLFVLEEIERIYQERKRVCEAMVLLYRQAANGEVVHLEAELQLLEYTYDLSVTYQSDFLGCQTIILVVKKLIGPTFGFPYAKIVKIQKRFGVSGPRLWHAILEAFTTDSNNFIKLHEFVMDHRSLIGNQLPIGYEPLIERCLARQNLLHLEFYVAECNTLTAKQKVEVYLHVKDYQRAAVVAFEHKNSKLLVEVYEEALTDNGTSERTRASIKRYVEQVRK